MGLRILPLCLFLLVWAWPAAALELGRLQVNSRAGEALRAQTELSQISQEDLVTLKVRVADPASFVRLNLFRAPWIDTLSVRIDARPNGSLLLIESPQPLAEARFDLLLELDWNAGHLFRQYTIQLDPPSPADPLAIDVPVTDQVATERPAPSESKPLATHVQRTYGPIKPGESLYRIARTLHGEPISFAQQAVGLYESNPKAFIGGNINRLRVGSTLIVPSEILLQTLSLADAQQRLTASLNAAVKPAAEKTPEIQAGKVVTAQSTPRLSTPVTDVLRVSRGAEEPDAVNRLRQLEEESAAEKRALVEARLRVERLEKTVEELKRVLAAQNRSNSINQSVMLDAPVGQPARLFGLPWWLWAILVLLAAFLTLGIWQWVRRHQRMTLLLQSSPPTFASIDLDLAQPSQDDDGRLSMARAHLTLGDVEGARTLLEQLITHGVEPARSEAERLLAGLNKA